MKLLTITTTRMPDKELVAQVGSIIKGKTISFDEAASIVEEAVKQDDMGVLAPLKFSFYIDLDGKTSRSLIVRAIMPFIVDISIKEKQIEFTSNAWQLRHILKRWLVMDNIHLQKMGAAIVLDLIHAELVFLIRDILDEINKGEINEE